MHVPMNDIHLAEIKAKALGISTDLLCKKIPETSIAEYELKRQQFNEHINRMLWQSKRHSDKYVAETEYVTKLHMNDKWPRMNKKKLRIVPSRAFVSIFAKSVHEACNRKGFIRRLFEHKLEN